MSTIESDFRVFLGGYLDPGEESRSIPAVNTAARGPAHVARGRVCCVLGTGRTNRS